MLLDEPLVSRKTPQDGKLEISPSAAAAIAAMGEEFAVTSGGREGDGRLGSLACNCGKRAGDAHVHHFLESGLLKQLPPGIRVRVELDPARSSVRVERAQ